MVAQERLGVVDFGRALIDSLDLDPIYVALARIELGESRLKRWMMAYWLFYSAATASWLSEQKAPDFWRACQQANRLRLPRGRERRHFRGIASENASEWLAAAYPFPEDAVDALCDGPVDLPFAVVSERVQAWPLFGPWIAFKVGDMLERLNVRGVVFTGADLALYSEPRAGAALAAAELGREVDDLAGVCAALGAALADRLAPPANDRPVGLQEVETVLCKWKAHLAGRYPVGIDTREIRHALGANPLPSATAERFLAAMP